MVATVVRDKYVQSETIIGWAEEAGELMTRMEQNDENLLQSLTVICHEWNEVLFSRIRWERMTPTASLPCSLLYQTRPSLSLILSPTPFTTSL